MATNETIDAAREVLSLEALVSYRKSTLTSSAVKTTSERDSPVTVTRSTL
jgi:hypothetical protein